MIILIIKSARECHLGIMEVMAIMVEESIISFLLLLTAPRSMKRTVGQRKRTQSPRRRSRAALQVVSGYV